ncbi:response regulator [Paraburkholderia sp. J41]|uniref:response regulator n=1 Tax=Paraburkholderia sp. J41 TaxID=2805433 RepID=UPI002AC36650|nr:response regulator [Paraburkholderia sp. J41]
MANILIVDDDPRLLDALAWLVASEGHSVTRAKNGRDALALAKANPPDIVITDYMMPFMNGIELADALSAHPALGHIPVVLNSAVAEPPPGTRSIAAFIRKPFAASRLIELVNDRVAEFSRA